MYSHNIVSMLCHCLWKVWRTAWYAAINVCVCTQGKKLKCATYLDTCLCTYSLQKPCASHYWELHFCAQSCAPLEHFMSLDTWVQKRSTSLFSLSVNYQRMFTTWALKCTRTWSVQVVHNLAHKSAFPSPVVLCRSWVHKQVSKLRTPVLFAVVQS